MRFQLCIPPQQISPSAEDHGEPLAKVFGNGAGFAKSLGDAFGVACRILCPVRRRRSGIDPNHAVGANAQLAQFFADDAGLGYLGEEGGPLLLGTHGRAAAGRSPNRGNERAHHEATPGDAAGKSLKIVIGGIDAGVRQGQEQIDTVEADAIHLRPGSQIEHGLERDKRFRVRPFANEAGPHRVVDRRAPVLRGWDHRATSVTVVVRPDCRARNA
jgi:hypothetical protein